MLKAYRRYAVTFDVGERAPGGPSLTVEVWARNRDQAARLARAQNIYAKWAVITGLHVMPSEKLA